MIAVFKQKSPGNIAVLFIFGLLVKLPIFVYPKPAIVTASDGRLYQWFVSVLPSGNSVLLSVLAFMLLYIQSLMVNYLVSEFRLIAKQNYLPAMAFMLITSLLPAWNYLSAPLLANTFIIGLFIYLFSLYNAPNARAQVFNIGLIAGISSYIYFPSVAFLICVLLGLMILKPFRINEIVLLVLGFFTPYYFHVAYLFLNDKLSTSYFLPSVSLSMPHVKSSIWLASSTVLLTIPFLMGGYYVQTHLRKMLIQVRKNWSVMLLYLILAFFVPFINSDDAFINWILLAAPFAAFHACAYFYAPGRLVALTLFFLTLGFILFQQYKTTSWH
ncbi:MAG: hypothetical protein ACJ75F_15010 [Flavisolibacter sp.]